MVKNFPYRQWESMRYAGLVYLSMHTVNDVLASFKVMARLNGNVYFRMYVCVYVYVCMYVYLNG